MNSNDDTKGRGLIFRESDDRTLKAPQSVIHIKHRITLRQYKYWILLLDVFREAYHGNQSPDENGYYRFAMSRLTEYMGYEPVKEELKKDFETLRKEPIIINVLHKDGKPVQRGMGFISEWEITSKTVGFKLPAFIEEAMRGLDDRRNIFQLLNWDIFNHFSGKYEAIIYKLCRDYVGVNRTPYMTIEEFREYMGLKSDEYKTFMRLGQWVIYGPCKAINESAVSDITVEPKLERNGRKTIGIYFIVKAKDKTIVPFIDVVKEPHPAFASAKVPILPKFQEKYLGMRSEEEIKLCIERANEYGEKQEKEGKDTNYGAIYRTAIEDGWHVELAAKKALEEKKRVRKKAEAKVKQQAEEDETARKERNLIEREALLERFRALPEADRERILSMFFETDVSARAAYKRKGFDSPFFLFPFVQHLKKSNCLENI